jgi:glucosamine 6-phosphate synthetase-like amidotransferase/phosphosugar isomerase protein
MTPTASRPTSAKRSTRARLCSSAAVVVAISHEAGTSATLDAARRSSEAGAHVVLVTAKPEGAPAGVEAIRTSLHDGSWCHTVAYLSPLLLDASFTGPSPRRARELIAAQLAGRPQRHEQAARLANCRRLLVVGSGVDEITAAELALKLEEATYVPTTPLGVEKVLHGHLPAADRDTAWHSTCSRSSSASSSAPIPTGSAASNRFTARSPTPPEPAERRP